MTYFHEVVDTYDLRKYMIFDQHVRSADFSSAESLWTLTTAEGRVFTSRHVMNCMGYFNLFDPYIPEIPGMADFQGKIVHAYSWGDGVEYENKRVVLIGSGSTAITTAPAIAKKSKSLVMLQRSPGYVREAPLHYSKYSLWALAAWLINLGGLFRSVGRFLGRLVFCRANGAALRGYKERLEMRQTWGPLQPGEGKELRVRESRAAMEAVIKRFPSMRRHFTPTYYLFEQRQCFAPGGDFFKAVEDGSLSIVTAEIERFTATGIQLTPLSPEARELAEEVGEQATPEKLEADLVVLATGMKLNFLGDVEISVDGHPQATGERFAYRGGLMMSGIPNLFNFGGYFRGTYTRRVELQVPFVLKVLRFMDSRRFASVVPCWSGSLEDVDPHPQINFLTSFQTDPAWSGPSYAKEDKASKRKPKVGKAMPWRGGWNYYEDAMSFETASVDDGTLRYVGEQRRLCAEERKKVK